MKFIKFLTRGYTLLEISLIDESLLKKNTSIPGIYHDNIIDISRNGLMDIYITKEDRERSNKWIIEQSKNPLFIKEMLNKGLEVIKIMKELPLDLLNKISDLENNELIKILKNLRDKTYKIGGYFDFTTCVDKLDIELDKEDILKLAKFHDDRKIVIMNHLKFIKKICDKIAGKNNIESGTFDYLTFLEIIDFLKGDLTKKQVNELQNKREEKYIVIWDKGKRTIITDNFEEELKKIEKNIEKEIITEIKGKAIHKGIIKGEVKIIKQTDSLKDIPSGKIIVTQMTNPEMTTMLKKCLAIVTDEGGLLCHAAHIAREFGIIAIIGTKIATKVLKDGDYIEVDANKGIVRKI